MQAVEIITTALATGAAAGLSKHAEHAITVAYNSFKSFLQSKLSGLELAALERTPTSPIQKSAVAEVLCTAQVDTDPQIVEAAQRLLRLIAEKSPASASAVGLTIERLHAIGNINLRDITVTGGGALFSDISAGGDFNIDGLSVNHGTDLKSVRQ